MEKIMSKTESESRNVPEVHAIEDELTIEQPDAVSGCGRVQHTSGFPLGQVYRPMVAVGTR